MQDNEQKKNVYFTIKEFVENRAHIFCQELANTVTLGHVIQTAPRVARCGLSYEQLQNYVSCFTVIVITLGDKNKRTQRQDVPVLKTSYLQSS